MIKEYFDYPAYHHEIIGAAGVVPKYLYGQERDWTCSIACIRALLETTMPENEFLALHKPVMGPHFSKEMKENGWVPESYLARYGCDDFADLDASDLWYMLRQGYRLMVEWDLSAGHWCVLTSIAPSADGYEITCYDPYFRHMRVFDLEEFFCMCHDYVAVKEASG